jgi:pyrroloquinoline-quinone synthase
MKIEKLIQQLDDQIQSRSILNHPFYVAWQQGELTRDQLAKYAIIYYPHIASFPSYLLSAIKGTDDAVVRSELKFNLTDEIKNPKPHDELWLDFAEEFGLQPSRVAMAPTHSSARNIVDTFNRLICISDISALTALYAYESQQPEVSRQKADGLQQFYSVTNPKSLAYFIVHAETDIKHSKGERNTIGHCLQTGGSQDEMFTSADEAMEAYWGLLDGICKEAGLSEILSLSDYSG